MMKALQKIFLLLLVLAASFRYSSAALYTIEADSTQFVQSFDSIMVGDTVKWVWVGGTHTTTSNGIPQTATPWSVMLDKLHTSFTYVLKVGGTYNYISVPDAPLMGGSFVASWPTGISNPSMSVSNFNIIGNPSRSSLAFHFTISQINSVDVSLYNILGTKLTTLWRGTIQPGDFYQTAALPSNISAGIYFVTLRIGDALLTKRIVID